MVASGVLVKALAAVESVEPMPPAAAEFSIERDLPSIAGATDWLNSPPFEGDVDSVRRAEKELTGDDPIAVESVHAVWRAFQNEYRSALYFMDALGRLRHHPFGEGDCEESEKVIQQLLAESGAKEFSHELVAVGAAGPEAAADWGDLKLPENYLGHERTENFASPGGTVVDKRHLYAAPGRLSPNYWALSGEWTVESEAAQGVTSAIFRNCSTGDTYKYPLRHLFLFIGADPNAGWSKGCIERDRNGFVVKGAGPTMPAQSAQPALPLETSRPGAFAIGDVRAGSTKRVAAAVGEGAAVVAQIHSFLARELGS